MSESTAPHPIILKLFERRGMNVKAIQEFLSHNLRELPELTQMQDMDKAGKRIADALEKNEKIGIFGDYDVDGTSSCALFFHFFKMLGVEVEIFQPSRFVEGYGIHPSSIDQALEKEVKLLITVDCGITGHAACDYALEKGIEIIVTDHHKDAAETLPNAYAVVNPNRRDEPKDSALSHLAGVGVAFAICWQIKNELSKRGREIPTIYPLLQFVALGTVCDLALLTPMNLKLVRHGLKQYKETQFKGIDVFLSPQEKKAPTIPSEKLSFNMGPMINSLGRLEHPEKALRLLISDNEEEAKDLHHALEIFNSDRKSIQAKVFAEAKEQVINHFDGREHLISIVYKEDWHEGVIGIVASKLVETFKAPAIVFTDSEQEGIIKASARTAGELNMFDCLKAQEDLFVKFGGHKAAAGLSMKKENYFVFKQRMKDLLATIPAITRTETDSYDLEIKFEDISPKLVRDLECLEPFGNGNEKPWFLSRGLRLDSYELMKDVHVRWHFSSLKNPNQKFRGISFNWVGSWGKPHPSQLFSDQMKNPDGLHAIFTLSIERWRDNEFIQLQVHKADFGIA